MSSVSSIPKTNKNRRHRGVTVDRDLLDSLDSTERQTDVSRVSRQ